MKKIICLILSLAMVLGMVTVANAADESIYREALEVTSAINVVIGDTSDVEHFNNMLTRAQAAKLIAYFILGEQGAEKLLGGAVFTDVPADHEYAKYIDFCCRQGIIHGFDDGKFYPEDFITGYQFGKLLVCVLGYDLDKEQISGPSWDSKIAALMYASGLMENLDINLAASISKEEAIQMCFNALKSTILVYTATGALAPVANYKTVETIYDDNKLQLGEKLYPLLVLKQYEASHTWMFKGLVVGTYEDSPAEENTAADENVYALFGFKNLVLNEHVFDALNINFGSQIGQGFRQRAQLREVLEAVAAGAEENTVLFSKELVGVYSPVLFAKEGEEIFVKANWVDIAKLYNVAQYLGRLVRYTALDLISRTTAPSSSPLDDVKLPTRLESVTSSQFDFEDLIDGNIASALWDKYVNKDETVTDDVLTKLFADKAVDIIDEFARVGLVNALKANGLKGIDLELVTPAIGSIPAVYKFTMPDRMVTGYDFIAEKTNTVTFATDSVKASALLLIQTGEFQAPTVKYVNIKNPASVEVPKGEALKFAVIPLEKDTVGHFLVPKTDVGIAQIVEAHALDAFVSDNILKALGINKTYLHEGENAPNKAFLSYSVYNVKDGMTIKLAGND